MHNVIYRARADGTSRRAVVAYKMDDANVNSAQPTMLPGQTFEVNAVLKDPAQAGMELSIDWPYGSNLHCEILVDDLIVVQADQFIAPRLLRPKDDPLYGVLQCGAPLNTGAVEVPRIQAHQQTRTRRPPRPHHRSTRPHRPPDQLRAPAGGVGPLPGTPVGVGRTTVLSLRCSAGRRGLSA